VEFLRRMHNHKLPFSAKNVDTVLDIMTLKRDGQTVFRGKTGSAFDAKKNVPTLGWFIGSVTASSGAFPRQARRHHRQKTRRLLNNASPRSPMQSGRVITGIAALTCRAR